ncbi:branched-chain amino acid ABC transporter ATP-binding protein/permease [Marinibaculum pumilum]|uniref:Branched-chain amino acid ABC transporter ATP-binding protein/permease n=1 Tax=Marinibaculum pumilum TaxID=1766165 RepID=A0ABV7L1Z1_9PROT
MPSLFSTTPSGRAGLAFALFALLVVPSIAGSQWLNIFTSTACFALAIAGVAFMYARLGMVSLTQVGLMGIGGWVVLRLNHGLDLPFEINLIAAGAVTMVLGMILALPALRLRGLYLALVTLMAAGGLEIMLATYQFPNGGEGFWGVQTGSGAPFRRPVIAQSDEAYLRYTVFVALLGFLLIELHRRLAPGRAWAMIRRSEAAAMSAGVNVTLYKTWAFALSGLLAGVAGGLLAGSLGLLDGGTFRASESVLVFALAVVGGAASWLGAVIAAALFRILPALLNDWGLDADLSFVIFGAGLLHAVITAPNGIAGQVMELAGNLRRRLPGRAAAPPAAGGLQPPVEISDVTVRFGGVLALDGVEASFSRPVSGIIGPNGAGKTTLMNVLSGFVTASDGRVLAGGADLMRMSPHRRSQWGLRRSFQKEEIADDLSLAENVRVQMDGLALTPRQKQAEVDRALAFVGLQEMAEQPAAGLNSFQRRLVDIAKCLVGGPRIVMFDEPAGGLSAEETRALGDLILRIHDETGAMTLVIDHDVDLISRICAETLVLDFGKRIAFGPTAEVLADPKVRAAYLGIEEGAA